MSCKNCNGSCIHNKFKEKYHKVEHKTDYGKVWMVENVFDGYEHFCDKNPKGYKQWHEEHRNHSYDEYKGSIMECYEPTETRASLDKLMESIDKLSDKVNS